MAVAVNDIADIRAQLGLSQQQFGQLVGAHWMTVSKWERKLSAPNDFQQALLIEFDKAAREPSILSLRGSLGALIVGAGVGPVLYLLLSAAKVWTEVCMNKVLLIEVFSGTIKSTDFGLTADSYASVEHRTVELESFESKTLPKVNTNFIFDDGQSARRLLKCTNVDNRSRGVDGHGAVVVATFLRRDVRRPTKASEPEYMDNLVVRAVDRDGRLKA